MRGRDGADHYGAVSIAAHWLTALVVLAMLWLGLTFDDMPDGPDKDARVALHVSGGLIVLALAAARLAWRRVSPKPAPLPTTPRWQARAADLVHRLLVLGLFVMPLSGIARRLGDGDAVAVFGLTLVPAPAQGADLLEGAAGAIHAVTANILMILILVHLAAALKHHVFDRDRTLKRMLGLAR